MKVKKIISGGQTGADRAALDFAIDCKILHGGWCPKGRLTEQGPLPQKYKLRQTKTPNYEERTEKNVLSSDATIIFCRNCLEGGSLFTMILAQKHKKPVLLVNLHLPDSLTPEDVRNWLKDNQVRILNVAGPRASKDPRIYQDVYQYLKKVFRV